MRCSSLIYALLSTAIGLSTLGTASANSRTGMAAKFGTMQSFGQAAYRFEGVKDRHSVKIMDELAGLWEKNSVLLPIPYRIAVTSAVEFASRYYKVTNGDSPTTIKKTFSTKMQKLLSARWGEISSTAIKLSSNLKEDDLINRGSDDASENSTSNAVENVSEETPHQSTDKTLDEISAHDRLFGDWTAYFSSNFDINEFNVDLGFDHSTNAAKAEPVSETATKETASSPEFDLNGIGGEVFLMTRLREIGNTRVNSTLASNDYRDRDVFFSPTVLENNWSENILVLSISLISLGCETRHFNVSSDQPILGGSDIDLWTEKNPYSQKLNGFENHGLEPEKAPNITKNLSGALGKHLIESLAIEVKNWTGAFRHIVAQFSRLHELF
jgi:hypothetical protein